MKTAFRRLIVKYADGRVLCNCREAYRDAEGHCAHGCSSNQIRAKEYIAERAEKEIAVLEVLMNLTPFNQPRTDPQGTP